MGQTIELLAGDIWWQNQLQRWISELAAPFIRFDSFRLFSYGILYIQYLRWQTRDNSIYCEQYLIRLFYYFLKEYFTSKIYADKPETIQFLENNIGRDVSEIQPDLLIKKSQLKIGFQDCGTCAVAHEATCQKSYLNTKWHNVIFVRKPPILWERPYFGNLI